ncbi:hypothetical protein L6R29_02200 [Myxococcota bacterium]|nr:hypothetical protein [Myxococcota bacterium]
MKKCFLLLGNIWLFSFFACATPTGTALQATAIQQSACLPNSQTQDPAKTDGKEAFTVAANGDQVEISFKNAHLRCEQKVTWEASLDGQILTAVVRPQEMNPTTVPRCDCRYDLGVKIGPLNKGKYTVKIQQKSDNYGSPSTTKDVHTSEVTIP